MHDFIYRKLKAGKTYLCWKPRELFILHTVATRRVIEGTPQILVMMGVTIWMLIRYVCSVYEKIIAVRLLDTKSIKVNYIEAQ